jgi:hypothetical protein
MGIDTGLEAQHIQTCTDINNNIITQQPPPEAGAGSGNRTRIISLEG